LNKKHFRLKKFKNCCCFFSFTSKKDKDQVEYKSFCKEIETVFVSDEFEKNPLLEHEHYRPIDYINENKLTPNANDSVAESLNRISQRVFIIFLFV
jgi:hypothetical protein